MFTYCRLRGHLEPLSVENCRALDSLLPCFHLMNECKRTINERETPSALSLDT